MNITSRLEQKVMMENFFTGSKTGLSEKDVKHMVNTMRSEKVQKQFCDYLWHTGRYRNMLVVDWTYKSRTRTSSNWTCLKKVNLN